MSEANLSWTKEPVIKVGLAKKPVPVSLIFISVLG